MKLQRKNNILLIICLLVFCSAFYLFSFNSGYGYDALEYLNIARSMLDGYPFFSFIPAKSCALYYLIAFFLSLGTGGHHGIAGLTTLVYAAVLLSTFFIVRKKFNPRTAFLSAVLVGICAFFMELNFLEPEGLVYILGLLGFYCISNSFNYGQKRNLLLAGFWIGLGMSFKLVAGFYFIALAVFIFFWEYFKMQSPITEIIKKETSLLSGFLISLLIPIVYFAFTKRLAQYVEWTYYFPLFKFPTMPFWLNKLYTKLLWFWILLILAAIFSMRRKIKGAIYSNPNSWLLILMGCVSLTPLLKSQASHFLFPGASFLSIYIASVLNQWIEDKKIMANKARLISGFVTLCLILGVSIYLYEPRALKRFITIRDYSSEKRLKSVITEVLPKNKKAIFFRNSVLLYWVSERYPNIPFFNFDVQSAYWVEQNPSLFLDALKDPDLILVEFNPSSLGLYDRTFLWKEENRDLMDKFYRLLRKYFVIYDTGIQPYVFWVRRD